MVDLRKPGAFVLGGVVAVAALTGCGGTSAGPGPASMMGSGSGYHYSARACSAPAGLPGTTIRVTLADMGMTSMMGGDAPMGAHMRLRASASVVAAGQVSLVAENRGWRTHELVVLPLSPGASAGQRVPGPDGKVSEAGSLGEASASCAAGTGEGIRAGAAGWVTLTLPRGRYELVCNLRNHYADGMYAEVDVR